MTSPDASLEASLCALTKVLKAWSWMELVSEAGLQAGALSDGDWSLFPGMEAQFRGAKGRNDAYAASVMLIQTECVARAIQCGAQYEGLKENGAEKKTPFSEDEIRKAYKLGVALRQIRNFADQLTTCGNDMAFRKMVFSLSDNLSVPPDCDEKLAAQALSDLAMGLHGETAESNLKMLLLRAKGKTAIRSPMNGRL